MASSLDPYRQKRNFKSTREPRGRKARTKGKAFVVQKHDARRLHYDFRLEMNGVLKSWAVTKGPSLVPGERRLAVHVEDHPLDYGDFEGTIPKGEYGGGTVIVWDRGDWEPVGDAKKAYAKGHLEFELHGEKLSGRWHLVRMKGKRGEKRENWLLIKAEDDAARPADAPDILEHRPQSVKTGRMIKDVEGEDPGWSSKTGPIKRKPAKEAKLAVPEGGGEAQTTSDRSIKGLKTAKMPDFIEPQLATLKSAPPSDKRYLHEIKFDGYRLQAHIENGNVRLMTRSGLDWTDRFGDRVSKALAALPLETAVIDGEMVVENGSGASDFSLLQQDLSEGRRDRFVYYAFDLLYLNGKDYRAAKLDDRKARLNALISDEAGPVRYSGHFEESGGLVLEHACRLSLEGLVSKRRDAVYTSGRSRDWIKSKCVERQEFVVAGYTPSSASKGAIGSLLLGVYDGDRLSPVGRVGTGFTQSVASDLYGKLSAIERKTSPYAEALSGTEKRDAVFVTPKYVADVEFRAWTADGHLRHASFHGLREDKVAGDVRREKPDGPDKLPQKPEKRRVALTHPDRVYWPDAGVTKEGLADYYADVWRWIAPHVVGRPLALLRCPEGIVGQSFFQKHPWRGVNRHIRQVADPKDKSGEPYIAIDDLDGLMGLVQSAVLEIHPWGSTLKDWDHPDQLVMDLDPGEGVQWNDIVAAARQVRQRLEDEGLSAFVKTSGGKGLHVVAPLQPSLTWPALKTFTKKLADAMASDSPDDFVSTISKAKRKGKILVDYLRNQRGMTAVSAYSTRARPGAAVSMPLAWEELTSTSAADAYTVSNARSRLSHLKSDPWADFRKAARPLKTR